jgi:hypothetical protein
MIIGFICFDCFRLDAVVLGTAKHGGDTIDMGAFSIKIMTADNSYQANVPHIECYQVASQKYVNRAMPR